MLTSMTSCHSSGVIFKKRLVAGDVRVVDENINGAILLPPSCYLQKPRKTTLSRIVRNTPRTSSGLETSALSAAVQLANDVEGFLLADAVGIIMVQRSHPFSRKHSGADQKESPGIL